MERCPSVVLVGLFLCLLVPACSTRKVGTVKHGLLFVENEWYTYQTPDGKSGSTNQVALIVLEDGTEIQALPYANYETADGAHHAQLTKEGQRLELEPRSETRNCGGWSGYWNRASEFARPAETTGASALRLPGGLSSAFDST